MGGKGVLNPNFPKFCAHVRASWRTVAFAAPFAAPEKPALTGAERKAFAAEVGRLILKLRENSNSDSIPIWNDTWLLELAEKSGMGKSSAYNWWAAFTKSAGLSITPKQATDENRQAFFAWLEAQKQAEDAEKKRKEEEAAEVGRIILKLQENSQRDEILNENKSASENWIGEMGKSSGTPTQTLYRWWDGFTKSAGLSITPKQATDENRQALFSL